MLSMMNNESRRAGWLSVEVIYQYDLRCFKVFCPPSHPRPATVSNHIPLAIHRIVIKYQSHPLRGSLRITPYSFIILQVTGAFGSRTLLVTKMSRKLDFLIPG